MLQAVFSVQLWNLPDIVEAAIDYHYVSRRATFNLTKQAAQLRLIAQNMSCSRARAFTGVIYRPGLNSQFLQATRYSEEYVSLESHDLKKGPENRYARNWRCLPAGH